MYRFKAFLKLLVASAVGILWYYIGGEDSATMAIILFFIVFISMFLNFSGRNRERNLPANYMEKIKQVRDKKMEIEKEKLVERDKIKGILNKRIKKDKPS